MCGIFASFDKNKFIELSQLNAYRGSQSSSVVHFDPDSGVASVNRNPGYLDPFRVQESYYKIGHLQAPTTDADATKSIHPAGMNYDTNLLWHNGIIKDFDVKRLQAKHRTSEKWDTMLLLWEIQDGEFWLNNLSQINGSFACVYAEGDALYLFRNEISPLFIDADLNISSVKFDGSTSLVPNCVHMVDFETRTLMEIGSFHTLENPYFFAEAA